MRIYIQMRKLLYVAVTLLLVLIITFSIRGTVLSQSRNAAVNAKYYRMLENEYIAELRSCLETEGYKNCGITMTWTKEEGKPDIYTVLIHHKRISHLEDAGKEALKKKLEKINFKAGNSIFFHEFLDCCEYEE